MSVAEAFAHFDANSMFDNTLARVRRTIGVRELPSTTNIREYLNAQGLADIQLISKDTQTVLEAANQSTNHPEYRVGTVGRRRERRIRRAQRSS